MRRKDREMPKEYAYGVIDRAEYGVLSVLAQNSEAGSHQLVSVPLSLVREGEYLYFHSAQEGEKVAALADGTAVTLVFVDHAEVPNAFSDEEITAYIKDGGSERVLAQKVFTTAYSSAIVKGHCFLVHDEDERKHGLRLVCEKYTPDYMKWFEKAIGGSLNRVAIYRVKMETITGKRKHINTHNL